jgi:hypothetical protein
VSHDTENAVLYRDFIADSLYGSAAAATSSVENSRQTSQPYFDKSQLVVSPPSIDFGALEGQKAWTEKLTEAYAIEGEGWTTPVELFKPHYAGALATHLLQTRDPTVPLAVIEFGGGNGTCARGILDHVQKVAPSVYKDMSYSIVDISPAMQARCQSVTEAHPAACRLVRASALAWHERVEGPCHVVAMEMLDNMPHDKVVWSPEEGWREVVLVPKQQQEGDQEEALTGERWTEVKRAVKDALITRALELWLETNPEPTLSMWQKLRGERSVSIWLPTSTLSFLEVCRDRLPQAKLLLGDFDELPSSVQGVMGPIVQRRDGKGGYLEFETVLVEHGTCDIFFPTDFEALRHMHKQVCQRESAVVKSRVFFETYANVGATATASGYNPMLEDYKNTSFLVTASDDLEDGELETV